MSAFTHLHVHSQYSLLYGALRLKDLVQRAKEMGMNSIAVTDRGNMFGAVDFYKKAKKAGLKPILGFEAYFTEGHRSQAPIQPSSLVLLARDDEGFANLRTMVSRAYLEGLQGGTPYVDMELLKEHSKGVIALSGDARGPLAQAVLQERNDHALHLAKTFKDVFEPGSFYLEVQPPAVPGQDRVNTQMLEISKTIDLPLVASNSCLYLERKDARAHEVLMCIGAGCTLDDPRSPSYDVDCFWMKPQELLLEELGSDFAEAVDNAGHIAELCNVEMDLGQVYLPDYGVPEGYDIESFLVARTHEGLEERYREFESVGKTVDKEVYASRLEEELGIIISMEFPGYFLIVQDFINWAKEREIPVGPGRGSGAGSLVAYALRITDIDPIPYGLLFERFLNPERVSMPDFDIDFCMNRRGEVIDYVTQKYGEMNVGQIATFGGLKARGVIKDVGRVLGFTFGETDRLSKMVPEVLGISLEKSLEQEPRLRQAYQEDDRIRDLMDIALNLEGLLKSTGIHAAGLVIGEKPLWEYCPVFRGANDELVTQFAKDEVEEAGLVKFDFLGLKTLTVIDDAVRMVNRSRNEVDKIDLTTQGLDDEGVYALIGRADTEGVFQLESGGFRELLKKLRPDKFEDIVAAVALYRPGPLNSGMLDDFIARKHGRKKVVYPHESLERALKDTYGVIVYQEQVMQIAREMAGFTLGAADLLRRAMGKKKLDVMAAQREVFAEGALERGVPKETATEIFDLMEKFAEYGFNKSHSAAYALLTYQTAYLKAHHKVEFMAAVLTNDRDNADKVAKGIRAARHIGITVLPPCVNRSGVHFDSVEGNLLFGMGGIRGVGTSSVEAIVEARSQDGPFDSLFNFCDRVDLKRLNKKTIEALIKTGAFDSFGHPRARLMAGLDSALGRAQNTQRDRASGQGNLFGMLAGPDASDDEVELPREVMDVDEWPEQQLLANEKSTLGVYVSGHPLDRYERLIGRHASATIDSLGGRDNYEVITLGGIQNSIRVRPFRNGNGRMAIIQFEDLTGSIEVIAMGDDFDRYEQLLTSDEPLLVTGRLRIDRDEDQTKISVRLGQGRRRGQPQPTNPEPDVVSLHEIRATRTRAMELRLAAELMTAERAEKLKSLLGTEAHQGQCEVKLVLQTNQEYGDCIITLAPGARVRPSDELNHGISQIFKGECELTIR